MARLFGTDGVRGLANADLSPELATAIAAAAARMLAETDSSRPVAVVGRDPRASGEMLEAAVVAGLTSAGADVLLAGILPTPALAYLTDQAGADVGIMLSASHNPMPDNGIKLFARGGHKLPDVVALLHGGGVSGQAGALRLGIARALIVVDSEDRPALKKAGFLTRDPRAKERKKPGLKRARKAPQYTKR